MNAQRRVAVSAACHIVGHKRFAISTAKPVCVGSCIARSRGNRSRACKDVDRYSGAPCDDRAAVRHVRCNFRGTQADSESRRGTLPSDRPGSLHLNPRWSVRFYSVGCCTVDCSTASMRAARLHSRQRPRLNHTLLRHHRLRSQRRRPTWPVPRPLVSNRLCGHLSGAVHPANVANTQAIIVFSALLAPLLLTLSGTDSISQLKDLGEARSQLAEVGVSCVSRRLAGTQPSTPTCHSKASGRSRPRGALSLRKPARAAPLTVAMQHRAEALEQAAQADAAERQSFLQDVAARRRWASKTASESRCIAPPFRTGVSC